MKNCKVSIDQFLSRNIPTWKGLEPGCSFKDLESIYHFNDGEGLITCGDNNIQYHFKIFDKPDFVDGISFYFYNNYLKLISTEYWSFDIQECDKIKNLIGIPSFKIDLYWKNEIFKNAEWVYPEKGISLGIIPETGLIARINVFVVCSPEYYMEMYYFSTPAREF